ncbi:MAG: redoxin domain-containing protein [Pirellulaceae bacterium]|nr:redoxin domain-containing protein [Pirellulaceae bacterium]
MTGIESMHRTRFLLLWLGLTFVTSGTIVIAQDESPQAKLDQENESFAQDRARSLDAGTGNPLSIGSIAPRLNVEHWLNETRDKPLDFSEFKKGSVYVVEFWATWCGPCISAMPHVAELQNKYADRNVHMISVTDESLKTVEFFLERKVPSARDEDQDESSEDDSSDGARQTYRQLTSAYHIGCDPDGSTNADYMDAAQRNGIPCAFLVGKTSEIEWIGHPMLIDDPLEQVVNDKWDRDAFVAEYTAKQQANNLLTTVSRLMRDGKTSESVEAIDQYLRDGTLEAEKKRFRKIKLHVLANDNDFYDQAVQYALELLSDREHDESSANDLCWAIYQLAETGDFENQDVLEAALELAKLKADDDSDIRPLVMDTVAHLQLFTGKHDEALKTQRKAFKLASDEQKLQLKEFLDELETLQKKIKPAESTESRKDAGPDDESKQE